MAVVAMIGPERRSHSKLFWALSFEARRLLPLFFFSLVLFFFLLLTLLGLSLRWVYVLCLLLAFRARKLGFRALRFRIFRIFFMGSGWAVIGFHEREGPKTWRERRHSVVPMRERPEEIAFHTRAVGFPHLKARRGRRRRRRDSQVHMGE